MSAVAAMLGERLHLQHGPIDLIVSAEGDAGEVRAAYAQARAAFEPVLQTLVDELPVLRRGVRELPGSALRAHPTPTPPRKRGGAFPVGPVAARMVAATAGHDAFITPMAAVAGSVADHILAAMREGRVLRRASVNNGGDIALWLGDGERFRVGVCTDPQTGEHGARVTVRAGDGIGGIATSGWRGRSHSLGIADAVTVLARSAAEADAAATLLANAVDLPGSESVSRTRAHDLDPDSDLGERLVTVGVDALTPGECRQAIERGARVAREMIDAKRVVSVFFSLKGMNHAENPARFSEIQSDSVIFSRIGAVR